VVDMRVTLPDGAYHDIDSNDRASSLAAWSAFREAMWQAGATIDESPLQMT